MPYLSGGSPTHKEYQRYRNAGKELHQKMIETYLDSARIEKASDLLKLGQNRKLILDTPDDLSILMDFALYEIREDGKTIVECYAAEKGGKNFAERELIPAMVKARTGLFKVSAIDINNCQLKLNNLIEVGQSINLTDISFSQTMPDGMIVFLRPIQFSRLTMTSGIAFIFPQNLETELIASWHTFDGKDLQRYAWFFQRSKSTGFEVTYL